MECAVLNQLYVPHYETQTIFKAHKVADYGWHSKSIEAYLHKTYNNWQHLHDFAKLVVDGWTG